MPPSLASAPILGFEPEPARRRIKGPKLASMRRIRGPSYKPRLALAAIHKAPFVSIEWSGRPVTVSSHAVPFFPSSPVPTLPNLSLFICRPPGSH